MRGNTVPQLWQYQIILPIAVISPRFSCEPGKFRVLNAVTALEIYSGLVHKPKMGGAGRIYPRKIFETCLVKHYGTEHQHFDVEGPRLHRIAVAAEYRYAKGSMIVESKPVAVGALHSE